MIERELILRFSSAPIQTASDLGYAEQAYALDGYKEVLAYNEARDWDCEWLVCEYFVT